MLRPLQDVLQGHVLEIGSGCGAITRFLGEHAAHVTAIEGSAERAHITKLRCRDLSNVDVYCDNFANFIRAEALPAKSCNVVTLIGVLEYSPKFITADDPFLDMLSMCGHFLKDDGILIIAIENQLGLKYFAGAYEDRHEQSFYGIHDLYNKQDATTLGRKHLIAKLQAAGFAHTHWLYPFPDYKLPRMIFSDVGLSSPTLFLKNLFGSGAANHQNGDYHTFSEEMAWPVIVDNGLAQDLANSFLIVASKNMLNMPDHMDTTLAYTYNTYRRRAFAKQTVFRMQAEGPIFIERSRLYPDIAHHDGAYFQHVLENEIVLEGPLLRQSLVNIMNRDNWSICDIVDGIAPWYHYLLEYVTEWRDNEPYLPGYLFDCNLNNLIYHSNSCLQAFDLEWHMAESLSLKYVMVRGLCLLFQQTFAIAQPAIGTPTVVKSLVYDVMQSLHAGITDAQWDDFYQQERKIQSNLVATSVEDFWGGSLHIRPTQRSCASQQAAAVIKVRSNRCFWLKIKNFSSLLKKAIRKPWTLSIAITTLL